MPIFTTLISAPRTHELEELTGSGAVANLKLFVYFFTEQPHGQLADVPPDERPPKTVDKRSQPALVKIGSGDGLDGC
jgi:hypothetical protein